MRQAIAFAAVGDEQLGEDPTVRALEEHAAALLGKEAAIFVPSATMANQIAIRIHTRPGDEIICHEDAHIRLNEGGGPAALSGCLLYPLPGKRGVFTGQQVRDAVRPDDPHFAHTRLVCVENTHNAAGGCVWSVEETDAVVRAARENGLALHLDGARLLNAAVASGRRAADLAADFDTVTLCLSKGLGAPVGAVLAGNSKMMRDARRWKHVFGGAMRQAGIIAAGGLFALKHNVDRLADDHVNARRLADGLAAIPGMRLDPYPETNIVFVDISETKRSGAAVRAALFGNGVRVSGGTGTRLRFVTHLDVSAADIDSAIRVAQSVFSAAME